MKPVTDLRFNKTRYHEYKPIGPLDNASIVNFKLPSWASSSVYLLNEALMAVKVKIVKKDGTALDDNFECSCINNVVGSVFSDMKMYFNGVMITSISQNYHYKAIFENILNFGDEVKTSWLQTSGFYTDTFNAMDAVKGGTNE